MQFQFGFPSRLPLGLSLLCIQLILLTSTWALETGGYRAHLAPEQIRFSAPEAAYSPNDIAVKLGYFQSGVEVRVMGVDEHFPAYWRVAFERPGGDPLLALIRIPSAPTSSQRGWESVNASIAGFPLLKRLLEHPDPWRHSQSESPVGLLSATVLVERGAELGSGRFFCGNLGQNKAWELSPLRVVLDLSNADRPRYLVEIWSKGEAFRALGFSGEPERNRLRRELTLITNFFDTSGGSIQRERGSNPYIRGLRDNVEYYLLPNDIRLALHFQHGEYLFMEIEQASVAARNRTIVRTAAELDNYLRSKVVRGDDGMLGIRTLPMINQGASAYCVPATIARVLQFYGYEVHTHSLAMLAQTQEQRDAASGGTLQQDMIRAMRRITDGSPFRLRELADDRVATVRRAIEAGQPILWLIDGHMRLVLGIDEAGERIAYSDSWGPGHEFKEMSVRMFQEDNRGMWVLEPR